MRVRKSIITVCGCLVAAGLILRLLIGCAASSPNHSSAYGYSESERGQYSQSPIGNATVPVAPATQPPSELWIVERGTGKDAAKQSTEQTIPYDDILRYPTDWPKTVTTSPQPSNGSSQPTAHQQQQVVLEGGTSFGNVSGGNQFRGVAGNLGGGGAGGGASGQQQAQLQAQSKAQNNTFAKNPSAQRMGMGQQGQHLQAAANENDAFLGKPADAGNDLRFANPGCGELIVPNHDGQRNIPVPLDHTDVSAQIQGYVASVHVAQRYRNPFNEKIEAVYVFPLPQDAAVSEFVMTIGDRHIRGIIREKAEAERIYHEARAQGYVASLLTQERPNIFTQSVANIEPNKQIDINITYFNTMSYVDGSYEFVFPMVVGPRFNPPGSTEGVGAVGRGKQGISGQATEVQYLKPNERSGHDIALSVDLNAGVPIEKLESANHKINVKQESPGHAVVTLDPSDSIPNKDFVLRYKVAGGQVKSAMFVQRDERGGYFTLMLFPPTSLAEIPRQPMEMVFTIDVSGSQNGAPLAQEKAATRYCLNNMNPGDTFQIVRFGDTARTLFPAPVPVTRNNVQEALSYIEGFDAHEGTMLLDGVRASLNFPHDPNRLRFVAFMTDGFIGNEGEALREIHSCLGPARIFSFGVGSSTNRYLLDHMATMGNGVAAYLGLNDDATQIMAAYFDRISHPALTNISVDFGDMKADEVFPERIGDLFVGRPVVVSGRFTGAVPKQVIVRGNVGGEARQIVVPINAENIDTGASHALASVWARTKLTDLGDRSIWQADSELPTQMRQTALEYGLVSSYTSFVAVDSLTKTTGDHGITVAVPVPVPDGVRYETTVQDGTARGPQD